MVEQVLDLDLVAGGQRELREEFADPVGQPKPTFGDELVDHGRDHHLADRADLEQRLGRNRRARVGIGIAEVQDRADAIRRVTARASFRAA